MKQFSQSLKYLIIGGVIGLITLLFPKTVYFGFDYVQGQKWRHTDLIAAFDFPVLRNEDEVNKEISDIENNQKTVFEFNSAQLKSSLIELSSFINSRQDSLNLDAFALSASLTTLLNRGLVSTTNFQKFGNKTILLAQDGQQNEKVFAEFITVENAKKELATTVGLPNNYFADFRLKPNVVINDEIRTQIIQNETNEVTTSTFNINKGELIISNGDPISKEAFNKLNSYKRFYKENITANRSPWVVFFGYLLLTCLIIGALVFYLLSYFPEIYDNNRKLLFILIWPLLFSFIVYMVESSYSLSSYLIPFCIIPIVIKNFYSDKLALFVHVVVILIASFLSKLGYEFTFIQILVGIVAVLFASETRYWNKFFVALGIILGTYILGYLGLSLINVGAFTDIDWKVFPWLGLNVLLTLLAYPFIPMIERLFGFTSDITLTELSDMNKPLLKEMSIKAPGTLQHSLQVSNLAEAATEKIGGNSLLVKVAALYHDIGKIASPQHYIENQAGGNNPHLEMNNFESAKMIIDHVTEGVKMAKKARLPKVIIDFILSHHGTTRVEYFYRNQLKEDPAHNFDESLFRYPGPNPVSKEETILMMADSIEAASKSLKNPTGQDIDQLVDKIISYKLDNHQFDDSSLNFDELEKCKNTFKSLLRSIYHVRVEYPDSPKQSS